MALGFEIHEISPSSFRLHVFTPLTLPLSPVIDCSIFFPGDRAEVVRVLAAVLHRLRRAV